MHKKLIKNEGELVMKYTFKLILLEIEDLGTKVKKCKKDNKNEQKSKRRKKKKKKKLKLRKK